MNFLFWFSMFLLLKTESFSTWIIRISIDFQILHGFSHVGHWFACVCEANFCVWIKQFASNKRNYVRMEILEKELFTVFRASSLHNIFIDWQMIEQSSKKIRKNVIASQSKYYLME